MAENPHRGRFFRGTITVSIQTPSFKVERRYDDWRQAVGFIEQYIDGTDAAGEAIDSGLLNPPKRIVGIAANLEGKVKLT